MKFNGQVTPLRVLQLSQTVHMVYTKRCSTSAVVERSLEVLGWQLGTAKFRDHDFPKKTSWLIEIHRTSENHMVLPLSRTMHMVSAEHY